MPRGAKDARRKMRGRSVGGARSRRRGAGRDFARHSRFRFARGAATVRCPDEPFRENASTSDARLAPLRASQRSARRHDAMLANLGKRSRSGRAKGPEVRCASTERAGGYYCRECPGKGICEHGRRRCSCKECGGASASTGGARLLQGVRGLEHLRAREAATPVQGGGGSQICGGQRYQCKECGGLGSASTGGRQCKECGALRSASTGGAKQVQGVRGLEHREHGRVRPVQGVRGSGICEHGRRHQCKECGGSGICEHGRHRHVCKECGARASASTGGCEACARWGLEHLRAREGASRCKECGAADL